MASVSREVHQQHRSLMIKLCDMMDPKHATYKNFIFILGASIPKGKLSRVQKNPTEVLALMEEEQLLKAGEYQHLKKALNDSGYKDILDILENGEKRITRQKRKCRDSDGPVADGSSNIEAATMSSVKPEASTSAATMTTLQGSSTQTMKPATTSPTATCTLTPNTSTPQTASVSATSTASSTTLIPTETVNSGATSSIQETPTTIAGISTTGHVMISYRRVKKEMEKACWIKRVLQKNGYSVWIDEDNLGTRIYQGMADGVEGAHVVLLCMSEEYKKSDFCRSEAEQAKTIRKNILPVIVEDVVIEGWLGNVTAGYLYVDLSGQHPSEEKMKLLLRKLAEYYKKEFQEPPIEPFVSNVVTQRETGSAQDPGANQSAESE